MSKEGMLVKENKFGGRELFEKSKMLKRKANKIEKENLERKLEGIPEKDKDKKDLERLGVLCFQLGKEEESQEYFKKAYKGEIEKIEKSVNRGNISQIDVLLGMYYFTGEKEKAEEIYLSEIKRLKNETKEENKDSQYYKKLARYYGEVGDKKESKKYSKLAKKKLILEKIEERKELEKKGNKNKGDWKKLIELCFETGERDEIGKYIGKLDKDENHEYLGFVYGKIEDREKSQEHYGEAYKDEINKLGGDLKKITNKDKRKLLFLYGKTGKKEKAEKIYLSEIEEAERRIKDEPKKYKNEKELRYLASLYLDLGSLKEGL